MESMQSRRQVIYAISARLLQERIWWLGFQLGQGSSHRNQNHSPFTLRKPCWKNCYNIQEWCTAASTWSSDWACLGHTGFACHSSNFSSQGLDLTWEIGGNKPAITSFTTAAFWFLKNRTMFFLNGELVQSTPSEPPPAPSQGLHRPSMQWAWLAPMFSLHWLRCFPTLGDQRNMFQMLFVPICPNLWILMLQHYLIRLFYTCWDPKEGLTLRQKIVFE